MDVEQKFEERLKKLEERVSKLESAPQVKQDQVEKLSIQDFLVSKQPEDDVQRTLAVGYYLEKYEGLKSFNVRDLESGFRRAKETVPANINYKVIRNVERKFMMKAKEKKDKRKAWYLTNKGVSYVESNFKEES